MNNYNSEHIRLKELGNSKFEVAQNESDIRGWLVKNTLGRVLGKVDDLLFDLETEKVLYMVLDTTGNELHLKDRKVLLPLEYADLKEAYRNVIYPGVMANELTELPTYEKGKISMNVENIVRHAFINTVKTDTNEAKSIQPAGSLTESDRTTIAETSFLSGERPRPQTVVGVFDYTNAAQTAIEYLLAQDFKRNQIDISSKALDEQFGFPKNDDSSLTSWFKSVFGNDNDAKTYTDIAKTRCIVTVHTENIDDAERAAEILDHHGALEVEDSYANNKFHSRILDRKEAGLKWGRNIN